MSNYDAAEYLYVLPRVGEHLTPKYDRMMYEYAWAKIRESQRLLDRERLRTPLEQWQASVRKGLMVSIGGMPQGKRPLNAKTIGIVKRDRYKIEKVVFESRPGWYCSGLLYLPEFLQSPVPAVLNPHGHWPRSRFHHLMQARCITLAQNGMAAFAIDMTGYGERNYQPHVAQALYLWLAGISPTGVELYDHVRALDYLDTRKEIKKGFYGVTGCSGGGWRSVLLAIVDSRIQASVVVGMSHSNFDDNFSTPEFGCLCEYLYGLGRFASYSDIYGLIAPKPLLIITCNKDQIFPPRTGRDLYCKLKEVYRAKHAPDNVELAEFFAMHVYKRAQRERMYDFFQKHLKGENGKIREEKLMVAEPEESDAIRCFPGGRIPYRINRYEDLYASAYNRRQMPEIPKTPAGFRRLKKKYCEIILTELFGGFEPVQPLRVVERGIEEVTNFTIDKYLVYSEPEIIVPTLVLTPDTVLADAPIVLCLHPKGKNPAVLASDTRRLISNGLVLISVDHRGVGETGHDHPSDEMYEIQSFYLTLFMGRPLMGQRVFDLRRTVDFVKEYLPAHKNRPIVVWGKGHAGLIALFAALLDKRISGLIMEGTPVSYKDPNGYRHSPVSIIPNALLHLDIPQVIGMCLPRKILVVNPAAKDFTYINPPAVDSYERMDAKVVRKNLEWAINTAEILGVKDNLQILLADKDKVDSTIMKWLSGLHKTAEAN